MDLSIWIMYFFSIYFGVFWIIMMLDKKIEEIAPRPLNKTPFVSVVIPAFNEEDSLAKTMESVLNLDYPKDKLELIVINDGSTDRTQHIAEAIKTAHPSYQIKIYFQKNAGKGAALNHGLKESKGEFFVCLDADSFVEPKALNVMLPYFREKEVGAVLPLMKITSTNSLILKIQWVEYLLNFFLKRIMSLFDCVHVTPGPFSVYRKQYLINVGGFDTNNLTEDLEMALRLQRHHYKIHQILSTEVKTIPPSTIKGWYLQRNRWYKGTLYNMKKHRDLIFNPKYGEFGMFHLPMVLISAALSLSFALFVFYHHMLQPLVNKLYNLSFINFDVVLMVQKSVERFNWLDLNFVLFFFTGIIFALSLIWIIASHKYAKESFLKKGLAKTPLYMLVYPYLLAIVWTGIIIDLVRGKKQKW